MAAKQWAQDPTQRGDEVAYAMRNYYEANRPLRWWEKRNPPDSWGEIADNLMIGLANVALNAEAEYRGSLPGGLPDAAFDNGMLAGLELAAVILNECLSESCIDPWKYDAERDEEANAFDRICEAASAIEARRAETLGSVEDESAVAKPDAQGSAA